jgi:transcriptional regulator with XRE-family HTH domain
MSEAVCALQKINAPLSEEAAARQAPATYAVLWSRDAAAEALNERRVELGMAMRELDDAAGQAQGTASKYLSPGRQKSLGLTSLFKLAGALGLRVTVEVDEAATAALLEQTRQRHAAQARPGNFAQKCGQRVLERGLKHLAALDWNVALAAVAEARRKAAAEQAAREAKAAAAAARKQAARPASRPRPMGTCNLRISAPASSPR